MFRAYEPMKACNRGKLFTYAATFSVNNKQIQFI